MEGGDVQLADFARPLKRVSESILVDELLRDLRCDRQHFALVVDEHGTAIGSSRSRTFSRRSSLGRLPEVGELVIKATEQSKD